MGEAGRVVDGVLDEEEGVVVGCLCCFDGDCYLVLLGGFGKD